MGYADIYFTTALVTNSAVVSSVPHKRTKTNDMRLKIIQVSQIICARYHLVRPLHSLSVRAILPSPFPGCVLFPPNNLSEQLFKSVEIFSFLLFVIS